MSATARLSLVDRADPALSIVAQCRLLKVARSTLYDRPAEVSGDDLAVMRRLASALTETDPLSLMKANPADAQLSVICWLGATTCGTGSR